MSSSVSVSPSNLLDAFRMPTCPGDDVPVDATDGDAHVVQGARERPAASHDDEADDGVLELVEVTENGSAVLGMPILFDY